MDSGVAASSRRMVSRTARVCRSGTSTSPNRLAAKKPMPKNMIVSIMDGGLRPGMMPKRNHATAAARLPELPAFSVNAAEGTCYNKFQLLKGIPGRLRGELQIADVGPEPQANAGPDRHQHDV